MNLKPFSAHLADVLAVDDVYLPLSQTDTARLQAYLPNDGDEAYLVITDGVYRENVLVTLLHGTLVATRGIDSDAHKFPKGSCIFFEVSIPVVKWLICNHNCCDGDCPVDAVKAQGVVLPTATVGLPWVGTAVFSGDLPMQIGVTGLPSWVTATQRGTTLVLTGTPTGAGTYAISIAAANNGGQNIEVQQGTITVVTE